MGYRFLVSGVGCRVGWRRCGFVIVGGCWFACGLVAFVCLIGLLGVGDCGL